MVKHLASLVCGSSIVIGVKDLKGTVRKGWQPKLGKECPASSSVLATDVEPKLEENPTNQSFAGSTQRTS
jgi:hypothetical protein